MGGIDLTFGHGDDLEDFRREYEAQIADFNPRQKAMFDKFYKPPVFSTLKSVKTGKPIGVDFTSHQTYIDAYESAIRKMNKAVKKGKIASKQAEKMGRRQKESEKAKLKIKQSSKGTSTKSTASGRYTDVRGSNSLKIKSGVQL